MRYRTLGRDGPLVSEVGFGCGVLAGLMVKGSGDERRFVVERALGLGINLFDTSPVYGNTVSETHLGETLAALAGGADALVATKLVLQPEDLSDIRAAVFRSIAESLRRLRRKSAHVVHIHNRIASARGVKPEAGVRAILAVEDLLRAGGVLESLEALRDQGRVEVIGCSAFEGDPDSVREVLDSGRVQSLMVPYSLLNRSAIATPPRSFGGHDYGRLIKHAARRGIGIVAIRVLEAGLLTKEGVGVTAGSAAERRTAAPPSPLEFLWEEEGKSPARAAIRFVLSRPEITTAVIGISTLAHVEEAVAAMRMGPLPDDVLARIEAIQMP